MTAVYICEFRCDWCGATDSGNNATKLPYGWAEIRKAIAVKEEATAIGRLQKYQTVTKHACEQCWKRLEKQTG